jgi:uncharacterized membrane protein
MLGTIAGRDTGDLAESVFGRAWQKNAQDSRTFLMTLLGLQLTVLSIVLSFNAPMIQSAANQYSPRLVPYYLKHVPLRRVSPIFALSFGYILAAVREVGLHGDDAVRPRSVISGAVTIAVVAFVSLAVGIVRTYGLMRVERVLALVRDATVDALARRAARMRHLRLVPSATLTLASDAVPVLAPASGYLVDLDLRAIARIARRGGARVRISRAVGDYFDEGEVVGWARLDGDGLVSPRLVRRLGSTLMIAPTREPDMDPAYGIRILAEVAARAISESYNDSYTARQALQQLRSILRQLARTSLGDCNIVDADGRVRASLMATQLREFLSIAIEAPLRYGAGDPEVLDGILEIALEFGLVAPSAETHAAAHQLINRVLEDAMEYGDLRNGRLKRLLAEADLVRASLKDDCPRPDRHTRADWALTGGDDLH